MSRMTLIYLVNEKCSMFMLKWTMIMKQNKKQKKENGKLGKNGYEMKQNKKTQNKLQKIESKQYIFIQNETNKKNLFCFLYIKHQQQHNEKQKKTKYKINNKKENCEKKRKRTFYK